MKRARTNEKPLKTEVIPVRVKPETVAKLQADVVVLEKDVADKQVIIDKLQADIGLQNDRITNLEGLSP